MTITTFKNTLKCEDYISIGGGEPTIHPKFLDFLTYAIYKSEYVWLATNGKKTEIALFLAKLAKKGVIGVALSLDNFHDEIDDNVITAFKKTKYEYNYGLNDMREIRNVSDRLIKAGRQKIGSNDCVCEDVFVKPNGDVHICGCKDSPLIGNVNNGGFNYPKEIKCYKQ